MLAAPVLALGLPTLVLLNMTDLMEARGGHIDPLKLARELGTPVAQISAFRGTGLDAVPLFLNQQTGRAAARPLTLPVMGNAASAHSWAAQVSHRTGYRAPLSVEGTRKIDNILLHRIWGPLLFLAVVVGVFEVVFSIGQPLSDGLGVICWPMPASWFVRCCPPAGCNRCCWTAHGRASPRCWSFCRRFCCFFSSSEFLKTPAICPARRSSPTASCARSG